MQPPRRPPCSLKAWPPPFGCTADSELLQAPLGLLLPPRPAGPLVPRRLSAWHGTDPPELAHKLCERSLGGAREDQGESLGGRCKAEKLLGNDALSAPIVRPGSLDQPVGSLDQPVGCAPDATSKTTQDQEKRAGEKTLVAPAPLINAEESEADQAALESAKAASSPSSASRAAQRPRKAAAKGIANGKVPLHFAEDDPYIFSVAKEGSAEPRNLVPAKGVTIKRSATRKAGSESMGKSCSAKQRVVACIPQEGEETKARLGKSRSSSDVPPLIPTQPAKENGRMASSVTSENFRVSEIESKSGLSKSKSAKESVRQQKIANQFEDLREERSRSLSHKEQDEVPLPRKRPLTSISELLDNSDFEEDWENYSKDWESWKRATPPEVQEEKDADSKEGRSRRRRLEVLCDRATQPEGQEDKLADSKEVRSRRRKLEAGCNRVMQPGVQEEATSNAVLSRRRKRDETSETFAIASKKKAKVSTKHEEQHIEDPRRLKLLAALEERRHRTRRDAQARTDSLEHRLPSEDSSQPRRVYINGVHQHRNDHRSGQIRRAVTQSEEEHSQRQQMDPLRRARAASVIPLRRLQVTQSSSSQSRLSTTDVRQRRIPDFIAPAPAEPAGMPFGGTSPTEMPSSSRLFPSLAWLRVGGTSTVCIVYTTDEATLTLFQNANNLLADVNQNAEPVINDWRARPAFREAVQGHPYFRDHTDAATWWMVAESAGIVAVGVGSKVNKRTQAAKLALAVGISVTRSGTMVSPRCDLYCQLVREAVRLRSGREEVQAAPRTSVVRSSAQHPVHRPSDQRCSENMRLCSAAKSNRSIVVPEADAVQARLPPPPGFQIAESFEFAVFHDPRNSYDNLFVDREELRSLVESEQLSGAALPSALQAQSARTQPQHIDRRPDRRVDRREGRLHIDVKEGCGSIVKEECNTEVLGVKEESSSP